jgi:hypothetical protein
MELKNIILNDVTNRQKKKEIGFNLQTNIFEILLSRYLKGVITDDVKYLMVYCIDNIRETIIDSFTIENGLTIKIPYNPIHFLELSNPEEKFQEYCRVLNEYISPVFREKKWDYTQVVRALDKIKDHNFLIEFLLKGTPKKSPDKNHIAFVTGVHTISSFRLIAKIYDKEGVLVKENTLVEEVPSDIVYGRFIGKPEWKDNKTFQVSSKTSQWVGSITI